MDAGAPALQRVFFALWPDAAALERLDALATAAVERCGGKHSRRDSLHLTLAFIGSVGAAQLDSLCAAAAKVSGAVPAVDIALDQVGWWPHGGILWAGCHATPSRQGRLSASLRDELATVGVHLDRRPWVPHVTLARHARSEGLPELAEPIRWTAPEFSLVESRLHPSGARYRILQRWPLAG